MQTTIGQSIELVLLGKQYSEKMVPKWINEICEDVLKKLTETQKPYKYMVNCTIMQRNGAAMVVSHTAYWDTGNDVMASVGWPKEKQTKPDAPKDTMHCMVSVYAISLIT